MVNNPYLRGSFITTKNVYKKLLKVKKNEWKNSMIQKLASLEDKDPKEYWKLVNQLREKKKSDSEISNIDIFTNFFETLFAKNEITVISLFAKSVFTFEPKVF